MAITADAHKALERYVQDCKRAKKALRWSIDKAVVLTQPQRDGLTAILTEFWARDYACPAVLDLKPQHGYQSRAIKDGYSGEDLVLWFVAGCSDVAQPQTDPSGRPRLVVSGLNDDKGRSYDLIVIISCDAHGYVHINDVIPKGLPPRK